MGNTYARMGRVTEAHETISKLEEHVQKSGIDRYEIALIYAGLGDKDEAFKWLEKSYDAHDKGLIYLKIDPCLNPLRSDPRFARWCGGSVFRFIDTTWLGEAAPFVGSSEPIRVGRRATRKRPVYLHNCPFGQGGRGWRSEQFLMVLRGW